MNSRHDNTRQHILDTGQRSIAGNGFSSVGLNEILTTAGVPKGSFYHYFESKEQFGQALQEEYFSRYLTNFDQRPHSKTGSARERLMGYWRHWPDSQGAGCAEQQCLMVKLSAEVSNISDAMRITLRDGTDQIVGRIAALIEAGLGDGSLPKLDPLPTAQILY